jgi:transposase
MSAAPDPAQVALCAGNNRQWRIIGVLNVWTGQVNYLDNSIVGRKMVAQLYQQLSQVYPNAEHIYVAQANWSIHRHADVLAILNTLPGIEPVWLPTYAHWLNPIEQLWRWLRQAVLQLHRWAADWDTLLAMVHAFLDPFAHASPDLLRYVGLLGAGKLATALRFP